MKTEKATPHHLREEGKKGKSFNSKDALTWLTLLVGVLLLAYATPLEPIADLFRLIVARHFAVPPLEFVYMAAKAAFRVVAPVFCGCVACIALVSLAQSRGILAFGAIKPNLSKLNPINGFKNLFSVRMVKELVKACVYLLLTCTAAAAVWGQWSPAVMSQVHLPGAALPPVWNHIASSAGTSLLLWMLPVAVLAAVAELLIFLREMKMDKNEVKQERKNTEGNPEIKAKHRQIREELTEQMKSDIAGSNVILANPTHIAIGLWMYSEAVPMPFVTLREKGSRARAVIAYAEKIGIPVVRDIPLARGLFGRVRRYGFVYGDNIEPVVRLLRWLRDVERAGQPEEDGDPAPPDDDVAAGDHPPTP